MPGRDVRTLRRCQRLTRPSEFRQTFSTGTKSAGRYMVLWVRKSEQPVTRVGVVASKRSIGKAYRRNRAKRRLREVFRLHRASLEPELDVVLIARPGLLDAGWEAVCRDFNRSADKVGILIANEEE